MNWILSLALMSMPLVFGEILQKLKPTFNAEAARKFVHISAALCASLLPLLLNLNQIAILAICMTPGMLYMHNKNTLSSMSSRSHVSYGDVFFGLGCAGAAFVANSVAIYVATVLIMGLADGLSGLVANKKDSYYLKTPGTKKPLSGRLVFMAITLIILSIGSVFITYKSPAAAYILVSSLLLTAIETVSPYGSDNFTISVVAALALNFSQAL